MIGNKDCIEEGFDPETAPDLSRDGWREKFADVGVRRLPGRKYQPLSDFRRT